MPNPPDYDPNCINAMFSRIMERLDSQDSANSGYRNTVTEELGAIRKAVEHTNGRVAELEGDSKLMKGGIAAVTAIISAGYAVYQLVEHWIGPAVKK